MSVSEALQLAIEFGMLLVAVLALVVELIKISRHKK